MGEMECKQCGKPCTNGLCEACRGMQPVLADPAAEKPAFVRREAQPVQATSPTDTILIPITPKSRETVPETPVSAEISPALPRTTSPSAKSRKYLYPLLGVAGVAVLVLIGMLWYRQGRPEDNALGTSAMQSVAARSAPDSYQIQIIDEDVKAPLDSATAVDSAASSQSGDPNDWGAAIDADRLDMKAFTADKHFGLWEVETPIIGDSYANTRWLFLKMEEGLEPNTLYITIETTWKMDERSYTAVLQYDDIQNTYAVQIDVYNLHFCFGKSGVYLRMFQGRLPFQESNQPILLEYDSSLHKEWRFSGRVSITSGYLNLRAKPDAGAEVIAKLENGQRLEIVNMVGDSPRFYEVYCHDPQKGVCHGYVAEQYVVYHHNSDHYAS